MGEFVQENLKSGKTIRETMRISGAAKYNPNDEVHRNFVREKMLAKYTPKPLAALPSREIAKNSSKNRGELVKSLNN